MTVKGPTKPDAHKPDAHKPEGMKAESTRTESTKPDPRLAERTRALDGALGEIEKAFGKGTIMRLGDGALIKEISCVPTGSIGLDMCLGGRGLPKGRIVVIFGPESSG